MINPFRNNNFCLAVIAFLLVVLINKTEINIDFMKINPFENNNFCLAVIALLLLVIVNKYSFSIIENMPSRLADPAIRYSDETIPVESGRFVSYRNSKADKINELDDVNQYDFRDKREFFNNVEEELGDEEELEGEEELEDEEEMSMDNRENLYNTHAYPQPIDDRPDLSQCQPCKCD